MEKDIVGGAIGNLKSSRLVKKKIDIGKARRLEKMNTKMILGSPEDNIDQKTFGSSNKLITRRDSSTKNDDFTTNSKKTDLALTNPSGSMS